MLFITPTIASAGTAQRTVYLVNHTDSRFPVAESIRDWNKAPKAEFVYTKTCNGKKYCTNVYQANLQRGYAGLTKIYRYSNGSVKYDIFLDTDYRPEYKRRSIVCHELGHAFEIGHNSHGCMTSSSSRYPKYPGPHNLRIAR